MSESEKNYLQFLVEYKIRPTCLLNVDSKKTNSLLLWGMDKAVLVS